MIKRVIIYLIFFISDVDADLPKGFAYLGKEIKNIELELKYYGKDNFVGKPIEGYLSHKAILSKKAIIALARVQKELEVFGLGLKVFDAYRPQKAVDHFIYWAKDLKDRKMKSYFYPKVHKKNLFKEGYIAYRSGHSRGSTVDLTIIDLKSKIELDMGSRFDFFGEISSLEYSKITLEQRSNRMLLNLIMLKHGFKSYNKEWWHFTLKDEPFPKKYFNFNIE